MSFLNKKHFVLFFLIIAILIGFSLGFYFGEDLGRERAKVYLQPEEIDFSLFWQAWNVIQEEFPDIEEIDTKKLIHGAISGMIESLEDPHTVFFTPEETERFLKDIEGIFYGVGMQIGIREEQLQVIAPIKETPAYGADLRAGDRILKIDDESTIGMTISEAVNLIRGPKGTEVVLSIYRMGWEAAKEIKVIRARIEIPSLSWELLEKNIAHPNEARGEDEYKVFIAHLKLYHFTGRIKTDFRKAAIEILESPAEKIILDLRNNPGGYLHIARNITGWFLERGQIVVIEDFGGNKQRIHRSDGPSRLLKYPIVVLINQGSASASEILAGALRDNRNVKLIGEKSFGKGSVQQLEKLKEGASLKITIANWLTPDKKLITNKGLEPCIVVEMTEKEEQDRDPQLDKAIEIIREMR